MAVILVPLDLEQFQTFVLKNGEMTLRQVMRETGAHSVQHIPEPVLNRKCGLAGTLITAEAPETLFDADNEPVSRTTFLMKRQEHAGITGQPSANDPAGQATEIVFNDLSPETISDKQAVECAYDEHIARAASLLNCGLSVLVTSDKLIAHHLSEHIVMRAGKQPVIVEMSESDQNQGMAQGGLRQLFLARLKATISRVNPRDVLVLPHLDLMAGAQQANLSMESRELIEILYDAVDLQLLAFADRSLDLPEVLTSRFDVMIVVRGVPRIIGRVGPPQLLGTAMLTRAERTRIHEFDSAGLYKNVSGMNAIRLRHAIRFAIEQVPPESAVSTDDFYRAIRQFKVDRSENFEMPNVSFDQIGGYENVKTELRQAIYLLTHEVPEIPDKLRRELTPRGFLFYGPPGTGKTLFAKAVAHAINATIQIVSGPEAKDKYVGEGERKIRELFAEARRNAPSVLVFDEFDSIASQRTGNTDGGARADNGMVAQILTEMDGFRPDVPMLVIATTNQRSLIDKALLRPARFRDIKIDLPDGTARRAIAEIHARHFDFQLDPNLMDLIANNTTGFNGDQIHAVFQDAYREAFCQNPRTAADARQFGRLIGRVQRKRIQDEVQESNTRR